MSAIQFMPREWPVFYWEITRVDYNFASSWGYQPIIRWGNSCSRSEFREVNPHSSSSPLHLALHNNKLICAVLHYFPTSVVSVFPVPISVMFPQFPRLLFTHSSPPSSAPSVLSPGLSPTLPALSVTCVALSAS